MYSDLKEILYINNLIIYKPYSYKYFVNNYKMKSDSIFKKYRIKLHNKYNYFITFPMVSEKPFYIKGNFNDTLQYLKDNFSNRIEYIEINPIKYGEDKEWLFCPKIDCHRQVVEIDELILPTIIEINKKGYTTEFCCFGHGYEEKYTNTYISFASGIAPLRLPEGFTIEKTNDKICIRKKYYSDTVPKSERFQEIVKTNLELLEWVRSLPSK